MSELTIRLTKEQQIEALSNLNSDDLLNLIEEVDSAYGHYDTTAKIISFFIDQLIIDKNNDWIDEYLQDENISIHLKHAILLRNLDKEKIDKFLEFIKTF